MLEQPIRDGAVVRRSVAEQSDIGAGPDEAIDFARDDPAPFGIEAKVSLDVARHFNRLGGLLRRAVGHRRHDHDESAVGLLGRDDNDGGPVFQPLFLSLGRFARPEVAV